MTKQFETDGASIISYPGEIRQIFSTLLINAMDAVPVGGRFALRISQSADWSKAPTVDGLRVTLADSGCGIPAHNASRIFEPFFTTKGENGTGLGLWVARGIADRLAVPSECAAGYILKRAALVFQFSFRIIRQIMFRKVSSDTFRSRF